MQVSELLLRTHSEENAAMGGRLGAKSSFAEQASSIVLRLQQPRLNPGNDIGQHFVLVQIVEQIVKVPLLGSRTFLRRFVKATGMKPSGYHQQLRIARSRELLEFTRETVDQIAAETGYEDSRGFPRTFKRVIGLSPAEYRRRFQQLDARVGMDR